MFETKKLDHQKTVKLLNEKLKSYNNVLILFY